jgi:hypothetical protein
MFAIFRELCLGIRITPSVVFDRDRSFSSDFQLASALLETRENDWKSLVAEGVDRIKPGG